MSDDPLQIVRRFAEAGVRLRLAPGVVGKSAIMLLGVILAWSVMFARMSADHPVFDVVLLAGGAFLLLVMTRETRKMREFAAANPALALLEGAQLLQYMKSEARMKELPKGDTTPPTEGPAGSAEAIAPEEHG